MKSFSKRVASFAMAAAMVCSLAVVSPVDAEAAAKPKFEKTRTAITAGTNYTYAVKNVTSKQYVKVYATTGIAVKYNNAKVTKGKTEIKGGKTIKVKINANNKVANYKGKVTVKVFNKKTNKKVKDLSDSFTVKCTKLAVTSVEPATMAGNHKYIVVNFNKALSSLDPSEVTIREKDTQRLVTVEKVALAADKKSATLTLLGDNSTSGETFVAANVDYVLTVTKSNATASMDFNFPAVAPNCSVTATDAIKSTISVGTSVFTVPSTITVDYQDILGRTVTFWYNKNHEITKLVVANETPVYGAFNIVSSNDASRVFVSKKDSNVKYSSVDTTVSGSTIYVTSATADPVVSGNNANYVKLVLNPNGTVRTYQAYKGMTNTILVESVSGKIVRQSKTTSVSLDKYTIVKDGKTITVDQIVKGDVVVYDTTAKFAEVYNDTVSGVITGVTATKVTIDGKAYDYPNNTTAKYIKDDVDKTLDEKTLAGFMASKENATLYFDRAGKVIFAAGTEAAVATNTTEYVLTQNAGNYGAANKHYLSLTGSNGTDKLSDIALDGIKFTLVNASQTVSGHGASTVSDNTTGFGGTWGTKTVTSDTIESVTTNNANSTTPFVIGTVDDIKKLSVVSVTRDSKTNDIKEIKVEQPTKYTVSGDEVFKGGLGKIAVSDGSIVKEYKISSSTPIYEVGKDNVVTKMEYSAFTKTTDKAKAANVNVFLNGNKDAVSRIVINNNNTNVYGVASDKYVTGVVTAKDISTIDGNHLVSLSVMNADGTSTDFASFTDTCKATIPVVGEVVTVKYAVDGEKNVADVITRHAGVVSANTCSGNDIRDNVVKIATNTYTLTENAKVVVVAGDGKSVKTISYSELQTMTNAGDNFWMAVHVYSEKYVDFVIVKEGLGKAY